MLCKPRARSRLIIPGRPHRELVHSSCHEHPGSAAQGPSSRRGFGSQRAPRVETRPENVCLGVNSGLCSTLTAASGAGWRSVVSWARVDHPRAAPCSRTAMCVPRAVGNARFSLSSLPVPVLRCWGWLPAQRWSGSRSSCCQMWAVRCVCSAPPPASPLPQECVRLLGKLGR